MLILLSRLDEVFVLCFLVLCCIECLVHLDGLVAVVSNLAMLYGTITDVLASRVEKGRLVPRCRLVGCLF